MFFTMDWLRMTAVPTLLKEWGYKSLNIETGGRIQMMCKGTNTYKNPKYFYKIFTTINIKQLTSNNQ